MALQYVGGKSSTITGAGSGNTTVSLSGLTGGIGSSPLEGDIVIVLYAVKSNVDNTLAIYDPAVAAYTIIKSELYSNGSTDSNLRVAWKIMGASPDASVLIGPTGATGDPGAAVIQVWRDQKPTTPILDATAATATGTGTDRPNPPSVTPTDAGSVVIVAAAGASQVAITALTNPGDLSNYIQIVSDTSTSGHFIKAYMGSIAWTSGAVDPSASTGGDNHALGTWCAITMTLTAGPGKPLFFARMEHLTYTRI